ncbi:MAG: hypothetical protein EHM93_13790 [Bacteroidales bacterium]|nr:MAG: hypothetical protein EHM93_13790 [Bacteroidales bacterium]
MKYIQLAILLFTLLACNEYNPQGDYDVEIRKPTNPPSTTFNLNDTDGPIIMCRTMDFTYSVSNPNNEIFLVEIYFNNSLAYTTTSTYGSFGINPQGYANGSYQLELKVYSKTKSGSLADKLNAEVYVTSKKWEVIVDKNFYPVQITSIKTGSGMLMITWDKYTKPDFSKYEFYRVHKGWTAKLYTITDPNITTKNDYTYMGGQSDYYIKTYNVSESKVSDTKSFVDSYPRIVDIGERYGMIKIFISKLKYYENFRYYVLYKDNTNDLYNRLGETHNVNDTVINTQSLAFGKTYKLILRIPDEDLTSFMTIGKASKTFSKAIATESLDYIFQMKDNHVYRYSISQKKAVDSLELLNANTDLFAASLNYMYLSFGNLSVLQLLNPLDFNQKTTFTSNDIFGDNSDNFKMVSISNNGIAAICGSKSFVVYDLFNKNIILKQDIVKTFVKISPDGKYLVDVGNSTVLYELNGTSLIEIKQWTEKLTLIDFNPKILNELIYYQPSESKINKMDCTSLSITQSTSASPKYPIAVDPITGLVLHDNPYQDEVGKRYDVSELGISYPLIHISAVDMNNFIFHNSTIYSSMGYSLKLTVPNK